MKKVFISLSLVLLAICTQAQEDNMALKVGSNAPDFTATDQTGSAQSLKTLLKKGPVVVIFYRGQWCPYCNKQLQAMEDSLSFITAKGATLLAITPETNENVDKTIEKTRVTYPILSDKGLAIMKAYNVAFDVDAETITKYKKYGIDFEKANGANGAVLPIPAVYIIDKSGKITYAYFDTNYKKRASVAEIVAEL